MATSGVQRSGEPGSVRHTGGPARFTVERHGGSTPHLELRLDLGGRPVSWLVADGPRFEPGDKRLALRGDDQPLRDAAHVWDAGMLENRGAEPLEDGLARGRLTLWFGGARFAGAFSLVRTPTGGQEQWLLKKEPDDGVPG
ncbi:DNA polymerase ligase N-terminal domain-containing protein [Prauserella oleivorans]|uniref:DNA polymerase ligase N-terminal domain-containing protein n=1 Tax=Prauserella oleivorans TaxID=1478153 RepID=A0ABW5WJ93_9PSEU